MSLHSLSSALTPRSRGVLVAAGSVATLLLLAGPVSAKGGGTPTTCSPVSSLKAIGDPNDGDANLPTIDVSYSVKPCDSKQSITVETTAYETFVPTNVIYDNTEAPTSGDFLLVVKLNTSYRVAVIVRDATTGAVLGSETVGASAASKGRA
jgi:hypothetical protein